MTTSCGNFHRIVLRFLDLSLQKIKRKNGLFFLEILFGVKFCSSSGISSLKKSINLFDVFYTINFRLLTIAASLTFCLGKIMPLKPSFWLLAAPAERLLSVANLRLESSAHDDVFFRFSAFIKSEAAKKSMLKSYADFFFAQICRSHVDGDFLTRNFSLHF